MGGKERRGGKREHVYMLGSEPGPGQLSEMVGYRYMCGGEEGREGESGVRMEMS